MRYLTDDGWIEFNEGTRCFTWVGAMANEARHKFAKIERKHGLSIEQSNIMILEALDANENIVRTPCAS